jgi:hypothetical protein
MNPAEEDLPPLNQPLRSLQRLAVQRPDDSCSASMTSPFVADDATALSSSSMRAIVPLYLLPDREVATFSDWLKARPVVEIVTRDCSPAYVAGINDGAPQARTPKSLLLESHQAKKPEDRHPLLFQCRLIFAPSSPCESTVNPAFANTLGLVATCGIVLPDPRRSRTVLSCQHAHGFSLVKFLFVDHHPEEKRGETEALHLSWPI